LDIEDSYFDNGIYQTIDLGIIKIVTDINTDDYFFEIKSPRPDNHWNPNIDTAKSRKDRCIGVKKGSTKNKRYLRIAKAVTKISRNKSNQVKVLTYKAKLGGKSIIKN